MVQISEDSFPAKDGKILYKKVWKPDNESNATLVFLHGFSDHCNCYYDFFPTLASPPHNITTYSFDQRGWGRSVQNPSDKGLTGPTSLVLSDIHDFLIHVRDQSALLHQANTGTTTTTQKPLFLMGHSMGGAEATYYLLSKAFSDKHPTIAGLVLEGPYIALDPASQPNAVTVLAGKLAAKLMPNHQLLQKLDATYMSHSAQVRNDWISDPLCHDTGTLEGLAGMLQRSADLVTLSKPPHKVSGLNNTLPCPLWQGHGSLDKVTSYPASKLLFDALQVPDGASKVFKTYEDAYHKLHAEPDGVWQTFAKDVGDWIIARVEEGQSSTANAAGADGEVKSKL